MNLRNCVRGPYLNIAHYTPVKGTKLLHGHTYEVIACIDGESNSFLIDFIEFKEALESIINNINYSLIVPKDEINKVNFKAPNTILKITTVEGLGYAEDIAKLICMKLINTLNKLLNPNAIVKKVCVTLKDPSGDECGVCIHIKS